MKYGRLGKIIGCSLLALGIGGCTSPLFVKKDHPRQDLAWVTGNGTYEECEKLDNIVKSAREDKRQVVGEIGEKIGEINGYVNPSPEPSDNSEREASEERKLMSIAFYVKAIESEIKGDIRKAISYMDTSIALYSFNADMYGYRGMLKYHADDINGAKSDLWIAHLLDYIDFKTNPPKKEPKKEEMFSLDDEVSL